MSRPSPALIPYTLPRLREKTMQDRASALLERLRGRRSVRHFSSEPIPLEVVRTVIHAAGQAPSGAHKQPWTFVLVTDPSVKAEIRRFAEAEEKQNYSRRMPEEWLAAVAPFGTDWHKPFLEEAPALIAVFAHDYELLADGRRRRNYYVLESCGIALGFLIAGLHEAGLAALTHTPSPMKFLKRILRRPRNERAFMLLPIGYPAQGCEVPDLARKPRDEILVEV